MSQPPPITPQTAPVQHLSQADPTLAAVIERLTLDDIPSTGDVFHDLMGCVLEQQIHYRSTKGLYEKWLGKASIERLTPALYDDFQEEVLKHIKLSARKRQSAEALAAFFGEHTLDWGAMDDDAVRKTLEGLPGIGPWAADMILLYTLGRPDVFAATDYHIKRVMADLYDLPEIKGKAGQRALEALAKPWAPHRSLATRYLLAWKDAPKW